jgi:hypothetical protein
MTVWAEATAEKAAVDEAVAATEEALDKALDAVPDKVKPVTMDIAETSVVYIDSGRASVEGYFIRGCCV